MDGIFAVFGTNALFTYFLSGVLAVVLWRWQWMTVGGERITLCGWLTEHVFSIFAMPSLSGLLWGDVYVIVLLGSYLSALS